MIARADNANLQNEYSRRDAIVLHYNRRLVSVSYSRRYFNKEQDNLIKSVVYIFHRAPTIS